MSRRPSDPDILDTVQVAELLGVNPNTVYEAIKLRVNPLPCQRLGAKLLRFYKPSVLEWMRAGQGAGRRK